MRTFKKSIAILLAIVFCFAAASCTTISTTTVKEDGKVETYLKIDVSEKELQKLEIIVDAQYGVSDLGSIDASTTTPEIAAILKGQTIEEVFNNFRNASTQEERDGVIWYTFETTKTYNSTEEFAKTAIDPDYGNLTTTDFWNYGSLAFDNSMAAMMLLYDIECKVEETMTMPYKITRTNGTKVNDYTVKLNNNTYFYIVTEKSTAAWTKAVKIEDAIDEMVKANLKPAKVTGLKVVYKSKNIIKISWNKNTSIAYGDYDFTKYLVERKEKGGKWKEINWTWGDNYVFDYGFSANKTYYYRVRGAVDISMDYDELYTYGEYSSVKKIKTADLKKKAKLKVTAGKKKVTLKVTNKSTNLSGYEIQYSTKKNMRKATVKLVKKLPKTIRNLKSGKKYYFRVRKYVKSGGKLVYSPYSKKIGVKVK